MHSTARPAHRGRTGFERRTWWCFRILLPVAGSAALATGLILFVARSPDLGPGSFVTLLLSGGSALVGYFVYLARQTTVATGDVGPAVSSPSARTTRGRRTQAPFALPAASTALRFEPTPRLGAPPAPVAARIGRADPLARSDSRPKDRPAGNPSVATASFPAFRWLDKVGTRSHAEGFLANAPDLRTEVPGARGPGRITYTPASGSAGPTASALARSPNRPFTEQELEALFPREGAVPRSGEPPWNSGTLTTFPVSPPGRSACLEAPGDTRTVVSAKGTRALAGVGAREIGSATPSATPPLERDRLAESAGDPLPPLDRLDRRVYLESVNPLPPHLRPGPGSRPTPSTPSTAHGPSPAYPSISCSMCARRLSDFRTWAHCPRCGEPLCRDCLSLSFLTGAEGHCPSCGPPIRPLAN